MRCPSLSELPHAPSGKTGWPWNEESQQLPGTMLDVRPWPKISIITPSYNQGQFIEETIRSVLLQGYPNLEYIIIDGGSTDNSVDIIKKYEPWLTYWISEPDRGQSHGINKGFGRATGQIFAWLNSDDLYCRGTILKVIREFADNSSVDIVYGNCNFIAENGRLIESKTPGKFTLKELLKGCDIWQQAVFWKKKVFDAVGLLNDHLHFVMDYDLWLRCSQICKAKYLHSTLANFRIYNTAKTSNVLSYWPEALFVQFKYGGKNAFEKGFGWRCLHLAQSREQELEDAYRGLRSSLAQNGLFLCSNRTLDRLCSKGFSYTLLLEGSQVVFENRHKAWRNIRMVFHKGPSLLLTRETGILVLKLALREGIWHFLKSRWIMIAPKFRCQHTYPGKNR